jgi:hypothetical protein
MRKDGSGLVARSKLSAEQEKAVREEWRNAYELRKKYYQVPTGRQETEDNKHSEDNDSDSSYQGSTDSTKVRFINLFLRFITLFYMRYNCFVNPL